MPINIELLCALTTLYRSPVFWSELIENSRAQAGPFDGGCLVCANAIIEAMGNGEIVRLCSSQRNTIQTEHYGACINGVIYDFNGAYTSSDEWITVFSRLEMTGHRSLHYAQGEDVLSDIPNDPHAVERIQRLIVQTMTA